MQSSKVDFLVKYNNLVAKAFAATYDLPDNLCEFLLSEYELNAVVLFRVDTNQKLLVLGKSGETKKNIKTAASFECSACGLLKNKTENIVFNSQDDCEIQASEYIIYEGCLHIKIAENTNVIFKISKKAPFSTSDKDNLQTIGSALGNILRIWFGDKNVSNGFVSEIITEIAHELRTPTNSIMGFASLLNEENLTSSQAEYVATLKDNALNLLALMNDLIDLAKVDLGQTKAGSSNINLSSFIDEITKIFSEKINLNKIEFITNIDKDIPDVFKLDSQKLRYILLNILTYSLRLTEKGKISITVSPVSKTKINFKISDSSGGISSGKLKEVFKPFSLSELGNNKIGNSTGLGFNTRKKIYRNPRRLF